MNRYTIEWNGKKMIRTGSNCEEAMDKACNAKVFGDNTIFFSPKLKMYDADTRGEVWATYKDGDTFIKVSKI